VAQIKELKMMKKNIDEKIKFDGNERLKIYRDLVSIQQRY
jgi:hypothetical protein